MTYTSTLPPTPHGHDGEPSQHIVVIGAGFTGLTAAWDLTKRGYRVTVLESDSLIGGLAGGFKAGGAVLEKFYHHWFNNDVEVTGLIRELGLEENLIPHQSRTGMYYAKSFFRLSTPVDLLKFRALSLVDRIRLGLLVPQAARVRDWHQLERLTAREWLLRLCGRKVYRVVWEPLLRGKFGAVAEEISAVWLWNKLCLRGGSRDRKGKEVLLYYRGGFPSLAQALRERIEGAGGTIITERAATGFVKEGTRVTAVLTKDGPVACDNAIITTALPIAANLLDGVISYSEMQRLSRVRYLANICLVLQLDRSLSDLYWINVNDPSFPFVGVIEHTNFEPAETYGGNRIVYLSRYLPSEDPAYGMSDDAYLAVCLPHLQRMFPDFAASSIKKYNVWRADYAQPIVERNYSALIPPLHTSLENVFISTMAQIYPEDRGTNYAVRSGRQIARYVAEKSAARQGNGI